MSNLVSPPLGAKGPRFYPHYACTGVKNWVLPLPVIDSAVARRSSEIIADKTHYPSRFFYGQYSQLSSVIPILALLMFWPLVVGFLIATRFECGRQLLLKLGPKERDGPSEAVRAKSWFRHTIVASDSNGRVISKATVSGGDPGYTETSKMVSECALLMAKRRSDLPLKGGVATPAAAFGDLLVDRLNSVGIKFEDVTNASDDKKKK